MSDRPHVVIIGAGFGGLAAARHLENQPLDVTVVDRNNFHTFQPLLYQVATAGLNAADVAYAVRGVFRRREHVYFRQGSVAGVDWEAGAVQFDEGDDLPFDHLIVAVGATANYFGTPGAQELGFPLYTLEDATRLRNHALSRFEQAVVHPERIDDGLLTFVVVGGGPTGTEVAGALAELIDKVLAQDFHQLDAHRARVIMVEGTDAVLGHFSEKSQRYAKQVLQRRGVEVRLGELVQKVEPTEVHLKSGEVIPAHTLIWAAGVKPSGLADVLGVEQGHGGRIVVADDLSIPEHPESYAIGDVAAAKGGTDRALPQLAQPAIQGGRHAAEQILRKMRGQQPQPFRYLDKGIMATIGRTSAVAEIANGPKLTGFVAWVSWLLLHLVYLLGFRNRVQVLIGWAWNYFTWGRGPRLIFRGALAAELEHRGETPPPA